jgi:hypothetical protein
VRNIKSDRPVDGSLGFLGSVSSITWHEIVQPHLAHDRSCRVVPCVVRVLSRLVLVLYSIQPVKYCVIRSDVRKLTFVKAFACFPERSQFVSRIIRLPGESWENFCKLVI